MGENNLIKKRRNIGITEIRSIHERQNGCCVYCGKPVDISNNRGRNWTIEHIIPYSIYKWSEYVLSDELREELWKRINDNSNCAISCRKCNSAKDARMPDLRFVMRNEHIPQEVKDRFKTIYDSCKNDFKSYENLIKRLYEKQLGRCSRCKKLMDYNECTIRRIDSNKMRVEDNASLLCSDCSQIVTRMSMRVNGKLILRHNTYKNS